MIFLICFFLTSKRHAAPQSRGSENSVYLTAVFGFNLLRQQTSARYLEECRMAAKPTCLRNAAYPKVDERWPVGLIQKANVLQLHWQLFRKKPKRNKPRYERPHHLTWPSECAYLRPPFQKCCSRMCNDCVSFFSSFSCPLLQLSTWSILLFSKDCDSCAVLPDANFPYPVNVISQCHITEVILISEE